MQIIIKRSGGVPIHNGIPKNVNKATKGKMNNIIANSKVIMFPSSYPVYGFLTIEQNQQEEAEVMDHH